MQLNTVNGKRTWYMTYSNMSNPPVCMLVNWSVVHKVFSAEYADSLAVQYNDK